MNRQILELLQSKIEDRKASFIDSVSKGQSKDFAEYKEMCGVIRGLATAQMEAQDLVRKLKEDDDE